MKGNYFTKLLTLFALLWAGNMYANNIQVTINSYDATLKKLNVTLSWDNSWHDGTGTFRDAAWVFVKYKDATMGTWETAPVATPSPATWQATGNNVRFEAIGKNPISTSAATDYRGLIVRRAKTNGLAVTDPTMTGIYNVSMTINIPLAFAGTPANPEFKIFALEMVDVPQGAFYAGDGGNYSKINNITSYAPKNITSEGATFYGNYTPGAPVQVTNPLPATFPKGFKEFYVMKYELSQEGYAEFLNTLSRTEQNAVVSDPAFTAGTGSIPTSTIMSSGQVEFSSGSFFPHNMSPVTVSLPARQGIKATSANTSAPAVFGCDLDGNSVFNEGGDGQNIPAMPKSVMAILYYLNWAGLSPMSELEFEKACRGPVYPVADEYCWGNANREAPSASPDNGLNTASENFNLDFQGPGFFIPSGLDLIGNVNWNYRIYRCGIFAKPSGSTRITSGGSYYGVMDLSNNAFELAYPMETSNYTDSPGNGTATLNSSWPLTIMNRSLRRGGGNNFVGRVSIANVTLNLSTQADNVNTLIGIRGVIR